MLVGTAWLIAGGLHFGSQILLNAAANDAIQIAGQAYQRMSHTSPRQV